MRAPTSSSFAPASGRSSRSSATRRRVRSISVTTWRVRPTSSSASASPDPDRRVRCASSSPGGTSASRSTPSTRADLSQEARRAPYCPSTRECLALVSMTSSASPAASRSKGTCSTAPVRQSSLRACPARQRREADWSIPPVGAPATSFSARTQAVTRRARPASSGASAVPASPRPLTSSRATAVALSRAAEEDRPPPRGTQEYRAASNPDNGLAPSRSRAQATPAM